MFSNIYPTLAAREKSSDMIGNKLRLTKEKLLEFTRKGNMSDARLTLGETGKKIFLGDDAYLFEKSYDDREILNPESVADKTLFYSDAVMSQINAFKNYISRENLPKIQARLAENGMNKGFCALFYGSPGTGKTESALQIAKSCGRGIVKVDMSQIKDAWVGSSEKNTKELFDKYRTCCEQAEKTGREIPILLLNEADALLSRRSEIGSANPSVEQMNNTMQNIIPDEMENFKGILIATTNMTDNLDGAFARRFIYKIKFDNPSANDRRRIWSNKINWLADDMLDRLSKLNFSGGQIENIAKKITMSEILNGVRPSDSEIDEYCSTEEIENGKSKPIGFRV